MSYRRNLASDLRHRGKICQNVIAPQKDALGQFPEENEPDTVATVWCAVIPQTGSLLTGRQAETELARTTHKIIIRWRKGVTPDMWVVVDGVRYDILYVMDPYLDRTTLELFCEVRNDGERSRN